MDSKANRHEIAHDGYIPSWAHAAPKSGSDTTVSKGHVPTATSLGQTTPPKVVFNQPSSVRPPKK